MTSPEPRLHDWHITPREYARQEDRRGKRHAYERIDPTRTALVVVDMVSFFVAESGDCQGIVPNINSLAAALRDAGGTIAWVLPEYSAEPTAWATEFYGPIVATMFAASGGEGTQENRLWSGLDARPGDLWAEKSAASAFFPGRSDLPAQLAAKGIDTILVTGTVTSVCCEATARDAATLGLRVIMVADGNAGQNDAAHNATLQTIYRSFGDVRPTAEVLELIANG